MWIMGKEKEYANVNLICFPFSGGHFFIKEQEKFVLQEVLHILSEYN